jgi:hypothetical protein
MTEKNDSDAKWVSPTVPPQRIARMWLAVDEADRRRRLPGWAWGLVTASLLLVVGLSAALLARPKGLRPGAEVESAQSSVATFSDGSQAELGPATALTLETQRDDLVEVKLRSGVATFEVAKRPQRQFVVHAHDVRVRVVGTRFTVRKSAEGVEVSVLRGVVEVSRGAEVVSLTAGQSWHSTPEVAAAGGAAPPEPEPAAPEVAEPDAPEPPGVHPAPATAAHHRKHPHPSAPPPGPASAAGKEAVEDAFSAALAARREGNSSDAATMFERFIRDYPADGRTSVAAFELGRIRMDVLNNPRGAVEALQLSLRLDAHAAFREEALSRVVRGLDALHDTAACEQARATYLSTFPNGAYAHSVQMRCAGAAP